MSTSPQENINENRPEDQLDETRNEPGTSGVATAQDAVVNSTPVKRSRGRPKGSKNKKQGPTDPSTTGAADAGTSADPPKKKRGRPPKEKNEEGDGAPPAKRKRGRPPKNPKPESTGETGIAGEGSEKRKKRGRPPKSP